MVLYLRDRSWLASRIVISVLSALNTAGAPVHRFPNLHQRQVCRQTHVSTPAVLQPTLKPLSLYNCLLQLLYNGTVLSPRSDVPILHSPWEPECAGMSQSVPWLCYGLGQLGVRVQAWTTDLSFLQIFQTGFAAQTAFIARLPGGLTLRG